MVYMEGAVGKRVTVSISTARAKFFELTDLVRSSGDDAVVVLEQRGTADRVALVREARLDYLEARVAELDKRTPEPFALAGSLASDLDDATLGDALRSIRQEWTPRAERAEDGRRRTPAARRRR